MLKLLFAAATLAAGTASAPTPAPPPAPSPAPEPAFPAPKLVQVTAALKCDWGPVVSATPAQVVINTPAGAVEIDVSSAKLVGLDGRATASATLAQGQTVRVYYLVEHGAIAREIDLIPGLAAEK